MNNNIIREYKHQLILAGYAIGILFILGILPSTTDFMNLRDSIRFVWVIVLGACGYLYYDTVMNAPVRKPMPIPQQRPLQMQQPAYRPAQTDMPETSEFQNQPVVQQQPQKFPFKQKDIFDEFDDKVHEAYANKSIK